MLSKTKKAYRSACYWATLEQVNRAEVPEGYLSVDLRFIRPAFRDYDRDNLVARMKSGLDGVADALHINDKLFWRVSAEVEPLAKGGFVEVEIRSYEHGQKI